MKQVNKLSTHDLAVAAAKVPSESTVTPQRKKLWRDLAMRDAVEQILESGIPGTVPHKMRWGRDKAAAVSLAKRVAKDRAKAKQLRRQRKRARKKGKGK